MQVGSSYSELSNFPVMALCLAGPQDSDGSSLGTYPTP